MSDYLKHVDPIIEPRNFLWETSAAEVSHSLSKKVHKNIQERGEIIQKLQHAGGLLINWYWVKANQGLLWNDLIQC